MDARRFLEHAISAARRLDRPRVHQTLARLATSASLRLDDRAGTARISSAGRGIYRIEVSPSFVQGRLRTDEDALHLILHELLHSLRGDFLRVNRHRQRLSPAGLNVALDILVDSHLARLAFPEPPPYLFRLYPWRKFPGNLLLPPTAMARAAARTDRRWREYALPHDGLVHLVSSDPTARARFIDLAAHVFREGRAPNPARIADLYARGWLDAGSGDSFLDAFAEAMTDEFPSLEPLLRALILLGDHAEGRERLSGDVAGLLGGHSDSETEDRVDRVAARQSKEFFEAVRKALSADGPPRSRIGVATETSVVGFSGRREIAFLACGVYPVFQQTVLAGPEETSESAHVYLDVSGSTRTFQGLIYGLTIGLGNLIAAPVYLFSNIVHPVSIQDLEEGRCRTTGGTDFDCLISHALEHGFRKILVVTDGCARLSPHLRAQVQDRRLKVFLVLTGGPRLLSRRCPLIPLAEQWWTLPETLGQSDGPPPFPMRARAARGGNRPGNTPVGQHDASGQVFAAARHTAARRVEQRLE